MKQFARAVRLAFQYKLTILGAVSCSLIVALMWGINLGTVYPFVEVVFQGRSLGQWVDQEIEAGWRTEGSVEILDGLAEGETVQLNRE